MIKFIYAKNCSATTVMIALMTILQPLAAFQLIGAEEGESKGDTCLVTICVQLGKTRELDALLSGGVSAQGEREEMQIPLYYAIVLDRPDCLYLLLKHKAPVNFKWRSDKENGSFPLSVATQQGSVRCAELLLAFSADVNQKNNKGNTSLYRALVKEDINMFRVLSINGAHFTAEDQANIETFPRMKAWLKEHKLESSMREVK